MYHPTHRKTRSKKEDLELLKGIAVFIGLAIGIVVLILGGVLS